MNFKKFNSNILMILAVVVLIIGGLIGVFTIKKNDGERKETEVVMTELEEEETVTVDEKKTEAVEPTESPKPTAAPEVTTTPESTATPKPTAPPKPTNTPKPTATPKPTDAPKPTATPKPTDTPTPTPTATPTPTPEPTPEKKTCTITIRCDTILSNMGNLTPGKEGLVPSNGVILGTTTVEFKDGQTVFDVLSKVCSNAGIQLEYAYTPAYGSYYIEGINNIYEFDCGAESGWMYKVDGWFPNYGCSSYTLIGDENIVWCYTCNGLGADVGA